MNEFPYLRRHRRPQVHPELKHRPGLSRTNFIQVKGSIGPGEETRGSAHGAKTASPANGKGVKRCALPPPARKANRPYRLTVPGIPASAPCGIDRKGKTRRRKRGDQSIAESKQKALHAVPCSGRDPLDFTESIGRPASSRSALFLTRSADGGVLARAGRRPRWGLAEVEQADHQVGGGDRRVCSLDPLGPSGSAVSRRPAVSENRTGQPSMAVSYVTTSASSPRQRERWTARTRR